MACFRSHWSWVGLSMWLASNLFQAACSVLISRIQVLSVLPLHRCSQKRIPAYSHWWWLSQYSVRTAQHSSDGFPALSTTFCGLFSSYSHFHDFLRLKPHSRSFQAWKIWILNSRRSQDLYVSKDAILTCARKTQNKNKTKNEKPLYEPCQYTDNGMV